MTALPCNTVQVYNVPTGVTEFQIQAEGQSSGSQSNSNVSITVQPGGIVRVTIRCSGTGAGQQQGGEK